MDLRSAGWNPWHGCTKYSPGCQYCYVYRQDEQRGNAERARECRKTQNFNLPVRRGRDRQYKIPSGTLVYTCFTSDFLLKDADEFRPECWEYIKARPDCWFYFFTKRIERFPDCVPADWGEGYDNVLVGCTVENQDRADFRLPIFRELPIKHKSIIIGPMLERMDISPWLDDSIEQVGASGESGPQARPCDYDWVLDIRRQCVEHGVPFTFHQTGANFIRDGKHYYVPRRFQHSQARKADIEYRICGGIPETVLDYFITPRAEEPGDCQLTVEDYL